MTGKSLLYVLCCALSAQLNANAGGVTEFLREIGLGRDVKLGMTESALLVARPRIKEETSDLATADYDEMLPGMSISYDVKRANVLETISLNVELSERRGDDGRREAKRILARAFLDLGGSPKLYHTVSGTGDYERKDYALSWATQSEPPTYVFAYPLGVFIAQDAPREPILLMVVIGQGENAFLSGDQRRFATEITGEEKEALLSRIQGKLRASGD